MEDAGAIYAVGDIHGCLDEFERVLARIRTDAAARCLTRPTLVVLGDVIDRGPQSREVIEMLMGDALRAEFGLVVLRGNHEQMLVDGATDWRTAELWLHNGGAETIESYGVAIGGKAPRRFLREFYLEALPEAHRLWMAELPLTHRVGRWLFVHAGVNPDRPLAKQRPADLLWIRDRFLDHAGGYPGGVKVVHGHTPDLQVAITPHRVGLDTGCGGDGWLSAVGIVGDDVHVVSGLPW